MRFLVNCIKWLDRAETINSTTIRIHAQIAQGRNFYPRCFDFAFGECDYFPPLRYRHSGLCARIVNLAVVSIRPPLRGLHGGDGNNRHPWLGFPQRTSCALPRRLVIGRMPNNCTIYYRRTSHLCDTEEAPGNIARKNAYKETSIGIKIPLGAICSLECVLWNKSVRHEQAIDHHSLRIASATSGQCRQKSFATA